MRRAEGDEKLNLHRTLGEIVAGADRMHAEDAPPDVLSDLDFCAKNDDSASAVAGSCGRQDRLSQRFASINHTRMSRWGRTAPSGEGPEQRTRWVRSSGLFLHPRQESAEPCKS
jgi:hypothetical protein